MRRIGLSTFSSAVNTENHPISLPEVSSFVAFNSAVPVFPASKISSRCAAYPVPSGLFTTPSTPCIISSTFSLVKAFSIHISPAASSSYVKYGFTIFPSFKNEV